MARSKVVKQIKTIRVDLIGSTVDFEGVWRRSDLDVAYRLMLKNLGSHYAQLRAEARTIANEELVKAPNESNSPPQDEGVSSDLEE